MRSRALAITRADPMAALAAASLTGAVALYAGAMIWARMTYAALSAYGPICGSHGQGLLGHCPACYVAAALAAVGMASTGVAAAPRIRA